MPKRTITPQQIVMALRRIELALAQGTPARAAIRQAGISSAAYYRWREEYGGMNTEQVQRLVELKKENARLQDRVDKLTRVVVWSPDVNAALAGGRATLTSVRRPRARGCLRR
jgi:putative transposase